MGRLLKPTRDAVIATTKCPRCGAPVSFPADRDGNFPCWMTCTNCFAWFTPCSECVIGQAVSSEVKPPELCKLIGNGGKPEDVPQEAVSDNVQHPNHYCTGGVECIAAIRASMDRDGFLDYCKGNVMKYVWRWRGKGGLEDLKKAGVYLNWMIEELEGKKKNDNRTGN